MILRKVSIGIGLSILTISGYAVDLMHVYQQALQSDPTFQGARATWQANQENLPQARAGLLPNLSATGNYQGNNTLKDGYPRTGTVSSTFSNNTDGFTLTLTQPLFNYANWNAYKQANAIVKQASATFSAAQQDLMIRVSKAYFSILQAKDNLRFTQAEKAAIARQLDQAKQRYNVGLDAITSVYDAQASYDSIVAQEIAANNDLINRQEELREITGNVYNDLAGVTDNLPLITPQPENIDAWVEKAQKQNYALQATRYGATAAQENIKINAAGHMPTLNAVASFTNAYASKIDNGANNFPSEANTSAVGLQVAVPIFAGGKVSSQTRQAQFTYQKALADMDATFRKTTDLTRQAYNSIIAGISKIKADKQAIVSAQSSLESTEAAFKVGTRTIVDVLLAQKNLYQAQRNYATDQYTYINNILTLKQQAGTLSPGDLQQINNWLSKPVSLTEATANKKK